MTTCLGGERLQNGKQSEKNLLGCRQPPIKNFYCYHYFADLSCVCVLVELFQQETDKGCAMPNQAAQEQEKLSCEAVA